MGSASGSASTIESGHDVKLKAVPLGLGWYVNGGVGVGGTSLSQVISFF